MSRSLPSKPSVRFLQVEAKYIIKAHKDGDAKCCEVLRHHSRFSHSEDEEILRSRVSLQDAQHALSLEYGFESWADLKEQVEVAVNRENRDRQKEVLKQIGILQTSEDESQQSHAIHVLGMHGDEEASPHIIPFIESPSEELRWVAVRSTIRLMGNRSRPLVYNHLLENAESDRIKIEIAGYFGNSEEDERSIQYLTRIFQTSSESLRRLAAYRLLGLRSDIAIPFLRNELRTGNRPLRHKSLTMLRGVEYPERIDDWQWVLDNEPVEEIKLKAIQIVGENRTKGMIPLIERLASSDDSRKIREAAGLALDRIRGD